MDCTHAPASAGRCEPVCDLTPRCLPYPARVEQPRTVPFRGRARWGAVATNLALAAGGAVLSAAVLIEVPRSVTVMHVLAWGTVYATVLTLVLAVALALTRQLPTVRRERLDGQDALVLRAWPGEWWHALALDLGLAVTAGVLVTLGLLAGSSWAWVTVTAGLVGAWFLARVVLTVLGRRRNEAVWLTPEEVVHDGPAGRERLRRTAVQRVRHAEGTHLLRIVSDGPVERETCPRPWRPRRRGTRPDDLWVDLALVGHDLDDVAAWLHEEITGGLPPVGVSGATRSRKHV
ncbi:MAG: hypothetical protein JWR42_709 [Marmoricola sp.]|nr:hypothetical protein [Marmoricola sp.]